nr:MAG TPA: hypothetical protein [Caudoviricetes sp.]
MERTLDMIHVKAEYDDPASATISIKGLPKGWDGADLRAGFVTALESLLAEANDADEVPDVGPVRVTARKNYEDTDEDDAEPTSVPTEAPDEPSVFNVSTDGVEAGLYAGIGEDAVRIGTVTAISTDGNPEGPLLSVSFENADGSGWGTFVAPGDKVTMTCGCDDCGHIDDEDDDVDDGPVLRVGSALAGLGLRKVEDVDPVDVADAAFPDDNDLNLAVVKLLRLAELRMQYAAAGRKVSGRMDMQKLWDLDRNIARARRGTWTRIGKEEKEYE